MRLTEIFDDIDSLAAGGCNGRESSRGGFRVTGLGALRYLFRRSVRFVYFDNDD